MPTPSPTIFKRLTLPPLALGANDTVAKVAESLDVPLRLVIKNNSAATCFFGTGSESMIGPDAPGADVFEVGPDEEEIFVLVKKQKLFGCANAIGAQVQITISEALPEAVRV